MKRKSLNMKKLLYSSIVANALAILIILVLAIFNHKKHHNADYKIISVVIGIMFLNCYLTVKIIYAFIFKDGRKDNLIDAIDSLSDMNRTLRCQRHDFVNHLQVMYNLLELEEYDEAKGYIENIYEDVIRVNKALKTSLPAVNALLQAKVNQGEKHGIEVKLYISTSLSGLKIPQWEFCRIIGNIIDNGIYALLDETCLKDKKMTIEIIEDLKSYKFDVSNNGPMIHKETLDKIFETGFTTKGQNGSGMGLSIVKEILEDYSGGISVESSEELTSFKGWIPK